MRIVVVLSCLAGLGRAGRVEAQVCTEVAPGVASIQTATATTTIKVAAGVPKANLVSCGFTATAIVVVGQAGNETVILNYVPPSIAVSTQLGAGKNTVHVYGTNGADTIVCGAGDVDRDGDGSADLTFDALPTTLAVYGRSGDDVVDCAAYPAKVTLHGAAGDDDLTGSAFNDAIDGGAGNDTIEGNAGNDRLTDGTGLDAVSGGAGNDTFVVTATADGADQLTGGPGTDNVSYQRRTARVIAGGAGAEDAISDDLERITGGQAGDLFDFSTSALPHTWYGGPGDDTIAGGGAADKIFGDAGNDYLIGGGGRDAIDAGDGDDALAATGDGHAETVRCGAGTDRFVGDPEDTFVDCERAMGALGGRSKIALGEWFTCALLDTGTPKCWGANFNGQLGQGDVDLRGHAPGTMGAALAPIDLGTGRTALSIEASWVHVCALLDDRSVKCWGDNLHGQLGLGDANDRGITPGQLGDALSPVDLGVGHTVEMIAMGGAHTCAILDTGAVKCWGYNLYGQLGLGDRFDRGDQPGEMGDALPEVDLGAGRTAIWISADFYNTCAVLDDGSVKCWGRGDLGVLGQGADTQLGDDPGEMGDALPPIDLGAGRTATQVAVGNVHACALLDGSEVKCWGTNGLGQLGLGDLVTRGLAPGEMGDALPVVDVGTGRHATSLSILTHHTCALLDDGASKCWGYNAMGQLGLGDAEARGDGPGEMGDALPAIELGTGRVATQLRAGFWHSCAALDDATVKCWGESMRGELGLGDVLTRGDEPGEMGDALPAVDLDGAIGFAPSIAPGPEISEPVAGCTSSRGGSGGLAFLVAALLVVRRRVPRR